MPASKLIIPEDLKHKVPDGFLYMVEHRWLINTFFFGVIYFIAVGVSIRTGVGWVLFGAVLAPFLFLGYMIISPLHIYHTPAAKFSDMTDFDKRDPVARQLVALMRSAEAQRFLALSAIKLSGLLLLSTFITATLQSQPLSWTLSQESLQWSLVLTFLCAVATLPIFGIELLIWSFRNWNRHARSQVNK